MLLQHPWLSEFVKPSVIIEEDEDEENSLPPGSGSTQSEEPALPETTSVAFPPDVVDREVAEWVIKAVEKRRQGKLGLVAKPALHAAPLDAVNTPGAFEHKEEDATPQGDSSAAPAADSTPAAANS
jgi:mitogen-activated protein kinase kinase